MKVLAQREPFFATRFDGVIYDCGGRMGFLLANLALALEREDLAPSLRPELERLLRQASPAPR
jgi:UTP--glucose-1-phosphate uridylyltransferase